MVKRTIVSLFLCASGRLWGDQSTQGELPRTYRVQAIRSVTIRENGAWNSNVASHQASATCSGFVLGEEDIRDYFRSAARISASLYNHLPFSSCYASGDILFASGASGTWYIDSWRRGELTLRDGRKAYFYGLKARASVFAKADPGYNKPSGAQPPRVAAKLDLASVAMVSVRKGNFLWPVSEEQKNGLCRFELGEEAVKDYLRRARKVSLQVYGAMPPSICHAEGMVQFSDGRVGEWMIESNRRGVLDLRPGGKVYLLSKEAQAPGFDPP